LTGGKTRDLPIVRLTRAADCIKVFDGLHNFPGERAHAVAIVARASAIAAENHDSGNELILKRLVARAMLCSPWLRER
jgi:hypothetical protein